MGMEKMFPRTKGEKGESVENRLKKAISAARNMTFPKKDNSFNSKGKKEVKV